MDMNRQNNMLFKVEQTGLVEASRERTNVVKISCWKELKLRAVSVGGQNSEWYHLNRQTSVHVIQQEGPLVVDTRDCSRAFFISSLVYLISVWAALLVLA